MYDNPSEAPANRRDNASVDDRWTINTRLAQICYVLVCLHILLFNYLLIVAPSSIYAERMREDDLVENLTAVAFLTAGILLFVAAWMERRIFPRCAYILGGLAMTFFGGEEISWGQRVIGFETPASLVDLNSQRQFNIHNIKEIEEAVFRNRYQDVFYVLGVAGCAAFFCRKERILGMPAPSILLTLALLVAMTYISSGASVFPNFLGSIILLQRGLFLILLLFALFSGNAMLFIVTAVSMSLSLAMTYVDVHKSVSYYNSEAFEYLISLIAFFYALVALQDQRAARQKIAEAVAALKTAVTLPSIRINPPRQNRSNFFQQNQTRLSNAWTAFCALIAAGSVGLAFLVQSDIRADAAAFKETYMLTQTIEPMARSNFDLYLDGRDLHYFKKPCNDADVQAPFFLGVFPENVRDLAVDSRQHGFENLDFYFDVAHRSIILDDACAAIVRLPAYEIAGISTGQYVYGEGKTFINLWIAEFPVNPE